ncbi:MAG: class I mannose-6-phosphate isomerase [Lachnospiraceae bacterium]|nr:class I mannose-6-phosphate isomerase [Lachnospiraceae bacterium]
MLAPAGKDYLWGGNRLKVDYNKNIDLTPLAETWECSTHPDGPSMVISGEYNGWTLPQVLKEHPDYLGTNNANSSDLPVLIKFIDAEKDLSVQVHPSDEYAMEYENGSYGKTEMWYVLDATEDAKLVYGFNQDVDEETLRQALKEGELEKYLNTVAIEKGDVFFIPSGQVHAIGAGAVIAEIQQNSNLTYRLYDYNRRDKDGNLRELHIDKALAVSNMSSSSKPSKTTTEIKSTKEYDIEQISDCKYFQVDNVNIHTEAYATVNYNTGKETFNVLLCVDGQGILAVNEETFNINKGDCVFVPANSVNMKLSGNMQILRTSC